MAESNSVKAESSQNGSSGVAASNARIQGATKNPTLVGKKVLFKQYPSGIPWTGSILSMQGEHFAYIMQDGMPSWLPQLTAVTDILGIFSALPTKMAPIKVAVSKAAANVAVPSEVVATNVASKEEFPELGLTEAQKKVKAAANTAPSKVAVSNTATVCKATVSRASPKKPKIECGKEIGDFVAIEGGEACVKAQLPALLNHTMSGKKTVKFEFPPTLMFDGHDVSVGANFDKPYVLGKLRENLGIKSDKIRVSINYAFERLPNGKLNLLKNGEITIFVSW